MTTQSEYDTALYYEAVIDIIGSLMAQCTAVQARAEHAHDFVTWTDMGAQRRAYLATSETFDPADTAGTADAIREYGTRLTRKVEASRARLPAHRDPSSYRLDREQHSAIFTEHIAPETLLGFEPAHQPVVVIVLGTPGSGKTTVIRQLQDSWNGPPPAVIDPELYLAYHPYSWDLVLADDRNAAEVLMADALGWTILAADFAVSQRYHVLLEIGTGSPEHTTVFTEIFRNAGYRVELQVVAIPEPISTLHALLRYHCRHGNWGAIPL
ncbi:zeta toxin family protein [Nocardia carnea]|uniref:zeta toxin family protein n=1 Tax=Nocardia carnea TaxID=37328 RepID=UPI0024551D07|nr:zeta toxin family protein [Nocardia carnea]